MRPETRVLGLTWVQSSTGVRLPIRDIASVIAEVNRNRSISDHAPLVVDCVHGLGAVDEKIAEIAAPSPYAISYPRLCAGLTNSPEDVDAALAAMRELVTGITVSTDGSPALRPPEDRTRACPRNLGTSQILATGWAKTAKTSSAADRSCQNHSKGSRSPIIDGHAPPSPSYRRHRQSLSGCCTKQRTTFDCIFPLLEVSVEFCA
jgi:hypothetical protein